MTNNRPTFKAQYDNFIGGKFVPPVSGKYFENISPIDGKVFTKAVRYLELNCLHRLLLLD